MFKSTFSIFVTFFVIEPLLTPQGQEIKLPSEQALLRNLHFAHENGKDAEFSQYSEILPAPHLELLPSEQALLPNLHFADENGKNAEFSENSEIECGKSVGVQGIGPTARRNLLSGGIPAELMEMPWHAGVYSKLFKPYKQICGGSLISHTVVISAAHCFWKGMQLPAENFAVAFGKIYRRFNHTKDEPQQHSDVREIHIPPRYYGSVTRFQEDLALLILTSPVTYTIAVLPVCLDLEHEFDVLQLQNGAYGKVGGWGLLSQDGNESPTLQVADMPYIDIKECVAGVSPAFREYITGDKICAGYTNGTALCRGDSGGGLAFPHTVAGETRYYLRGVVSTAPGSEHKCNVFHWATFTHVQRHQHYIQDVMKATAPKILLL